MQTGVYIFEAVAIVVWAITLGWTVKDCRKSNGNRILWGALALVLGPLSLIPYFIWGR
ncbi:MAG: hypothetical protein QGH40_00115 [bacterium]|jgi:hypothetical protein|nr:hypothetical protein [bacterium]